MKLIQMPLTKEAKEYLTDELELLETMKESNENVQNRTEFTEQYLEFIYEKMAKRNFSAHAFSTADLEYYPNFAAYCIEAKQAMDDHA